MSGASSDALSDGPTSEPTSGPTSEPTSGPTSEPSSEPEAAVPAAGAFTGSVAAPRAGGSPSLRSPLDASARIHRRWTSTICSREAPHARASRSSGANSVGTADPFT
ncbi:PT domain-containing protein [Streptomyces sp. NPDC058471]|uniref:PT domain-containing protein n=1 Tax=Streptomyces sp. NPDC058471 TaxID=3346516 RepID=UPI0036569189